MNTWRATWLQIRSTSLAFVLTTTFFILAGVMPLWFSAVVRDLFDRLTTGVGDFGRIVITLTLIGICTAVVDSLGDLSDLDDSGAESLPEECEQDAGNDSRQNPSTARPTTASTTASATASAAAASSTPQQSRSVPNATTNDGEHSRQSLWEPDGLGRSERSDVSLPDSGPNEEEDQDQDIAERSNGDGQSVSSKSSDETVPDLSPGTSITRRNEELPMARSTARNQSDPHQRPPTDDEGESDLSDDSALFAEIEEALGASANRRPARRRRKRSDGKRK